MSVGDWLRAAVLAVHVAIRLGTHLVSAHVPGLRGVSDRYLVGRLNRELERYGYGEFVTDPSTYRH